MDRERLLDFSQAAVPEGASPWIEGRGPGRDLTIVDHDLRWSLDFRTVREAIIGAAAALQVEHVGSTSVPGLPAKPIVDICVVVLDPDREDSYVPALEPIRQGIFRDWLRKHPTDRDRYAEAKRAAAAGGGHVMDYNARKQAVLREILVRAISEAG